MVFAKMKKYYLFFIFGYCLFIYLFIYLFIARVVFPKMKNFITDGVFCPSISKVCVCLVHVTTTDTV